MARRVRVDVPEEPLTVYTTRWCGDCRVVKSFLRSRGVAYREVDVGDDARALAFVRSVARGNASVPTLAFPDGRILVEPDLGELGEALRASGVG